MPPHGTMLGEALKSQGYQTAALIGSYTRCWGVDRIVGLGGIDLFEDIETLANRHRFSNLKWSADGRALNDRLWSWLGERDPERPFFAIVWNVETHYPYEWPTMTPAEANSSVARRYELSIEHADTLLGSIVDGLAERGLAEDTLLVVMGDHGEGVGRPPHTDQRLHGLHVWEDSLHTPLVFAHPGFGGSFDTDVPASLQDIYPTLLELIGAEAPSGLEGSSLASPLPSRLIWSSAMQWWPVAVRSGPFKFILSDAEAPGVLFDIDADPLESVDIAASRREIAAAFRAAVLFETAQRRRYDLSMDSDRQGLRVRR